MYPRMSLVEQRLQSAPLPDVVGEVRSGIRQLHLEGSLPKGSRIAIACGSRGIENIALVTRTVVEEIRRLQWEPFLVPAMGSHGGATADGQTEVLSSYGLTEQYAGAPILSSMEVEQIGTVPPGLPVYLDRHAAEADATIVINRVKVHTDFGGPLGSGLLKMMVAGLGNHLGAEAIHTYGARGLRELMPEAARMVIEKAPILFGVALIEDGWEHTSEIHVVLGPEIKETEVRLLQTANNYMAQLPFDEIDLLLVDRMGKEISGIGMDTNVIGRMAIRGEPEFERPRIRWIAALDLTDSSHGNASGLGLADFTVERLTKKIDYAAWMANATTSGFPERGKIPMTLSTDREVVDLALRLQDCPPEAARVVRIWDTLHLRVMSVSESLLSENDFGDKTKVLTEPRELAFLADGSLEPVDWHNLLQE